MPSWGAIADLLARRMYHHAFCNSHPESEADLTCPFCRDRAAFRAWQAKKRASGATEPHELLEPGDHQGESVDVFADYRLRRHTHGEGT